jgi:hypothetical protein
MLSFLDKIRIKHIIAPVLNARINASKLFLNPKFIEAILKKSISPIPMPLPFVISINIRKNKNEKIIAFNPSKMKGIPNSKKRKAEFMTV